MQAHSPANESTAGVANRELPGGFWSSAWPLLVAALISALLLRACVIAPPATPPRFDPVATAEDANAHAVAALSKLKPGASSASVLAAANLVRLNFAPNSAELPAAAHPVLAQLVPWLASLPAGTRVQIAGHTDDVGSPPANERLGRARATAVRDFLASQGLPAERMVVVSFGDTRPIADNRSEEGRWRNRRIDFSLAL